MCVLCVWCVGVCVCWCVGVSVCMLRDVGVVCVWVCCCVFLLCVCV